MKRTTFVLALVFAFWQPTQAQQHQQAAEKDLVAVETALTDCLGFIVNHPQRKVTKAEVDIKCGDLLRNDETAMRFSTSPFEYYAPFRSGTGDFRLRELEESNTLLLTLNIQSPCLGFGVFRKLVDRDNWIEEPLTIRIHQKPNRQIFEGKRNSWIYVFYSLDPVPCALSLSYSAKIE